MTTAIAEPWDGDTATRQAAAARRVLVESALLGVLADGALRNFGEGLGWTLWVAALALATVIVVHTRGMRLAREQALWLAVAVGCATAFAWRDAEELRVWNVAGTLVALGLFAMVAAGQPATSVLTARVRDVILAGIYMVRDMAVGAPFLAARDAHLHALPAVRGGASWTGVRAVLITAPVVLVFTALLARADPVFGELVSLPQVGFERVMSHVLLAGAFAWWSAGWMRGAVLGVSRRAALPDRLPLALGAAEVGAALGAVIALFTVFVALQVRWLFGGADVVLATTGLTLAEYARKGFFELVAVAALVIPLVLGTGAAIADEHVRTLHRRLSVALVVLLAAIMASAVFRMQLYVGYFGLTTDRLYALAIMAWLGVVIAAMALTVLRGWGRPFAAIATLAAFVTLFTLNMINPERIVARVNLAREPGPRGTDYAYLARLSGDASPLVARALSTAPPSASSCSAAKRLRLRWSRAEGRSWNLGARRGHAAVRDLVHPTDVLRLCAGGEDRET